ncbi:MAG TPA: hypothetical protein VE981_16090 [Planctomycetota bacterium]|nr:hypothetical protein [Planctomycetota bacterium]
MRIRIVVEGPSRYPVLGDCPCGQGSIRTVSNDGSLLFFECGLKSEGLTPCCKRFEHRGGEDGQILCATGDDPTLHDFGRMIDENGVPYFESHLSRGSDL